MFARLLQKERTKNGNNIGSKQDLKTGILSRKKRMTIPSKLL